MVAFIYTPLVGCDGAGRRNNEPLPQLPAYNCNPQVSIKLPRCLFPWEREEGGKGGGGGVKGILLDLTKVRSALQPQYLSQIGKVEKIVEQIIHWLEARTFTHTASLHNLLGVSILGNPFLLK